ncbi:MAG: quinolinate synthase NadA [Myxococcota bacterium]
MAAQPFPSLQITADSFIPKGAFAEAQAEFLTPDGDTVAALDKLLREKNIGVVAHFYMDPELQGVLTACDWPHIRISDSLLMADSAIEMVEAGVRTVVVLGVDFMSENVRAMLTAAGHPEVPVYRVAAEEIGCSLAESAEALAYGAYLTKAKATPRSLHVIYINTSLRTKAQAQHLVPTITCTSSNVVRTILQAAVQIPDVHIWYGPDTYMGRNLMALLRSLGTMDDAAVREIHPDHTADSVRSLADRFHYFRQGVCVVHHMFGADVAHQIRADYPHAFVTAHLEVPGEMFELGLEAQRAGRGVVGSTSNILSFITDQVKASDGAERLSFLLGTEAGMITSIVRAVRAELRARRSAGRAEPEVEIVFPVASEAIAQVDDPELQVVPGVASGEGCTVAGGCATCPFMKMNSLDALLDVANRVDAVPGATLLPLHPKSYEETIDGRTAAELGGEPILHMRAFQNTGQLSSELTKDILTRGGPDVASDRA